MESTFLLLFFFLLFNFFVVCVIFLIFGLGFGPHLAVLSVIPDPVLRG